MKSSYPKYRYIMGALVCLSLMFVSYAISVIPPLLTTISSDLKIDVSLAGYLSSTSTLFMGISLMTSTVIIERFGTKLTMVSGTLLAGLGSISALWSDSLLMLTIGRALIGLGCGTVGSTFSTVAAAWFPTEERPLFVTVYTICSSIAGTLSYATAIPLLNLLHGSWKSELAVCGIAICFTTAAWAIFGRELPAVKSVAGTKPVKKRSGLAQAVKRIDIWLLVICNSLATIASGSVTIYLPSFLETVQGMPAAKAALYGSLISIVGIFGTIIGGLVSTAMGKRRPVIIMGLVAGGITMAGIFSLNVEALIVVCIVVYGFTSTFRAPAMQTAVTELKDCSPETSAAGYSLMFGIGSVIGIVTPQVLQTAEKFVGMRSAMLLFAGIMIPAVVVALFLPETGPKRGRKYNKIG